MKKIPVGILGATGRVGQQYVQLLSEHPWFEIRFLASSEQSAGKSYEEAIFGREHLPIPSPLLKQPVRFIDQIEEAKQACRLCFSALSNEAAKVYEEKYAANGLPVISNAGYHRKSADVPILIPEINAHHCDLIPLQQKNRNWEKGFIVCKPNCSLQSYMLPLAPLHSRFIVEKIIVTTLQAVSGAGYPGVSSLDMIDNIIPYIAQEEEKTEQEPLKIWGSIQGNFLQPARDITIAAHCNRVPVLDGHLACVSVKFAHKPKKEEILALWKDFKGNTSLPSQPEFPVIYREECDRPQPRQDRHAGNGMSVTCGRLRECPLLDFRFVALSHNTIRGAAGGGILNAELLVEKGHL